MLHRGWGEIFCRIKSGGMCDVRDSVARIKESMPGRSALGIILHIAAYMCSLKALFSGFHEITLFENMNDGIYRGYY